MRQKIVVAPSTGLLRNYLHWSLHANIQQRAQAVNAMARLYLYGEMSSSIRSQIEIIFRHALDDDVTVRQSLAEVFAGSYTVPRQILLALVTDVSAVSRMVLAQSPCLEAADLIDCLRLGDVAAQWAIAQRSYLPLHVANALIECGERVAILALLDNKTAELEPSGLWCIFDRYAHDEEVREHLMERTDITAALRAAMASAMSEDLAKLPFSQSAPHTRRADYVARMGREQAFAAIALSCEERDYAEFITWLRHAGHLTISLFVRTLAGGNRMFLVHSLANLAKVPAARVLGLIKDCEGAGFSALYKRAGLPGSFLPAFRVLLSIAAKAEMAMVSVDVVLATTMLNAIEALENENLSPLAAMLARLVAESERALVRDLTMLESPEPDGPESVFSMNAGNENFGLSQEFRAA